MYAKTLVPGAVAIPTLTATTSNYATLKQQMLERGWAIFGQSFSPAPHGELVITHERLQVVVDGQILLDDLNPAAPSGWWDAVDGLGGVCPVVIARTTDLDLNSPTVGKRMRELMDTGGAVWAALPVTHSGPDTRT